MEPLAHGRPGRRKRWITAVINGNDNSRSGPHVVQDVAHARHIRAGFRLL